MEVTGERPSTRFHALDAFRGLLAIMVCVCHAGYTFLAPLLGQHERAPLGLLVIGGLAYAFARLAVLCFFCLSGWVIALSAERNVQRNGVFRAREFVLSRVVRLVPPLLVAVVVPLLLSLVLAHFGIHALPEEVRAVRQVYETQPTAQLIAIATLGLAGDLTGGLNRPLWTLATEVQLYVVVGLLLVAWRSVGRAKFVALIAAAGYVAAVSFHSLEDFRNDVGFQVVCGLSFALGWAAYYWRKSVRASCGRLLAGAWLIVPVLMGLFALTGGPDAEFVEESPFYMAAEVAFSIGASALVLLLSERPASVRLASLGGFAYSLYVVHFPVLVFSYFVAAAALGPLQPAGIALGLAAVSAALALAFCAAIGRWIERPETQRRWIEERLGRHRGPGRRPDPVPQTPLA